MNGHSPASAASDFLVPGLIVLVPGFVVALGVVFGGDPAKVLAFLLSTLTVAASLALAFGFAVLTRVYVRAVQAVLFHGDNPRAPEPGPEDPAEFGYHGGPAWWDLAEVGSRVAVGTGPFAVLLLPHLAVQAVLVLTHLAWAWTAVAVLRLVDGGLLRYRRIRMLCPRCFEHMTYPSHECDRCGRVHRDVRPGRRGLLRRRCLCGRSMPTLLLLGAAGLGALCPHCGQGMEHRPGEARELPVALFGGTGAGKTRLTHGLYAALEHAAAGRPGARVEPADEDTRHRLGESALALSPGRRVPPTQPGRRARGLALRVTAGTRTLLLQVYDAAGEWFDRTDRTEELTYLGRTGTFVLVVDPLSVPAVWNALGAGEQRRLAGERSLTPDPERPYMQVRDEVQRQYLASGRGLWRSRLAVVITRGDLLAGTSLAPADVPAERWVREVMGLNNLLRAARSDFGSVEVFVTGAVVAPGGDPDPSLTTLLRWLLVPEAEQFTGLAGPGPAPPPLPGSVPNPGTHAARAEPAQTGPTRTGRAR